MYIKFKFLILNFYACVRKISFSLTYSLMLIKFSLVFELSVINRALFNFLVCA